VLARLDGFRGVAAFDAGLFDPGERLLRDALRRLDPLPDHVSTFGNYLGQLLVAAGRYDEAETLLLHALRVLAPVAPESVHQGYNLGLLGKLYLDWDRPAEAEEPLRVGWGIVESTGNVSIRPILRNYLAELFLSDGYSDRDPARAYALAEETASECRTTGFQRSELAALALGALAALVQRRPEVAGALSGQAADMLVRAGAMPALRTEEVFLTRSTVLRATGDLAGAGAWCDRARSVLLAKAASIGDPDRRSLFLRRVRVSREILAAGASEPSARA
jgi:tetratricopeptide (TPR) repeat protein